MSAHVERAKELLGGEGNFSSAELAEEVRDLMVTHRAMPYPFEGLCAPDEHAKIDQLVQADKVRWGGYSDCSNSHGNGWEKDDFSSEKEAIDNLSNGNCQICGEGLRVSVSPYLKKTLKLKRFKVSASCAVDAWQETRDFFSEEEAHEWQRSRCQNCRDNFPECARCTREEGKWGVGIFVTPYEITL